MFLSFLNEREGKLFLELANIAMNVDGEVVEGERTAFHNYKVELGLQDYVLQNKSYKDVVMAFQGSKKNVLRAIIVEIGGVLDADGKIDVDEENWLTTLGKEWGFKELEIKKLIRWIQEFNDLLEEGYNLINKR
ncbi:MAG: hypothetical protein IJC05_01455 [Phascolarctobacterium sp.]|nr:hypothetical protein [Phascolarctobacterium sp.]